MSDNKVNADEIDPREQEYDIKHHWYDSDNSRHNYLGRLAGTEAWVCWRRWQVGPSETDYTVYGVGELVVEPADLSVDHVRDAIESDAETLHERGQELEADDYEQLAVALRDSAATLAETLVEQWQEGAQTVLHEDIRQRGPGGGNVPCNKQKVWTHREEAYAHEVERAMAQAGIKDTADSQAYGICKSALQGAVRKHQISWADGEQEYIGDVRLSSEPTVATDGGRSAGSPTDQPSHDAEGSDDSRLDTSVSEDIDAFVPDDAEPLFGDGDPTDPVASPIFVTDEYAYNTGVHCRECYCDVAVTERKTGVVTCPNCGWSSEDKSQTWEELAAELEEKGDVPEMRAKAVALVDAGLLYREVAEKLGLSDRREVGTHVDRYRGEKTEGEWLANHGPEL
jgi:hypothetical protein